MSGNSGLSKRFRFAVLISFMTKNPLSQVALSSGKHNTRTYTGRSDLYPGFWYMYWTWERMVCWVSFIANLSALCSRMQLSNKFLEFFVRHFLLWKCLRSIWRLSRQRWILLSWCSDLSLWIWFRARGWRHVAHPSLNWSWFRILPRTLWHDDHWICQ